MELREHNFRDMILKKASHLGLREKVLPLSDIHAVRLIQHHEGNTPCFGADYALHPNSDGLCGSTRDDWCCWSGICNAYRREYLPIDKALLNCNQVKLEKLRQTLMADNKHYLSSIQSGAGLGMRISSYHDLTSLTKKIVIGSPKTLVSESPNAQEDLKTYLLAHTSFHNWPSPGGTWPVYDVQQTFLRSSDISALVYWLDSTTAFQEDGTIRYCPIIQKNNEYVTVHKFNHNGEDCWAFPRTIIPRLVEADVPHLGFRDGYVSFSEPNIIPLVHLDLPAFENISLDLLHKVMSDYPEELSFFRDFLQENVEKMRSNVLGSESFAADIRNIERAIREQQRKLESDLKKNELKAIFETTGLAVASWTLALICILNMSNDFLSILGPSGVLYRLNQAYSDYLRNRLALRDNPAYFLWVLGRTKRK